MARTLIARWIAAALVATALVASVPSASEAQSAPPKAEPELLAAARAHPDADFAVIVRGAPSPATRPSVRDPQETERRTRAAEESLATGTGLRRSLGLIGGASATLRGRDVVALAADARVDRIVADRRFEALDEGGDVGRDTGGTAVRSVNAPLAWTKADATGHDVTVAILDSGVTPHPDLGGRLIVQADFVGDGRTGDPGGHGTHVAGLIAGDGSASNGAFSGVAPRANIVSVRVIDANGQTSLSRVFAGLQWVLQNRHRYDIRIVNMSFGAPALSSYAHDLLASAAELLYFSGIVVVVSAGNGGPGQGTITTPGNDPFVITVGADDDAGTVGLADDSVALWSSRGPTAFDGLAKPDVLAPGRKIVGPRAAGSAIDLLLPGRRVTAPGARSAQYLLLSGTSMAAAMVSGVAALVLERDRNATPLQVKRQLMATAHRLPGVPASAQGSGVVDAYAAIVTPAVRAAYTPYPASSAFADQMKPYLFGQRLVWRDLAFHGGVDSRGIPWGDITWDDITWDSVTWEGITWEAFNWKGIPWQSITWEDITWETTSVPLGGNAVWAQVN